MASGDILLDDSGAVILDDSGAIMLSDGAGDDCCCGCVCSVESEDSYAVTLDLAGCTDPLGCRDNPDDTQDFDTTIVVFNHAPDFLCFYTAHASCHDTADITATLELIDDPTYGCVWWLTFVWRDGGGIDQDIFTGYRTRAAGIVGGFTKVSGCATSATVS